MDVESQRALANLVASRASGALGTLHDGAPLVSFVLFSSLADGSEFQLLVSGMSAHTGDMRSDPRVSLMISAPEDGVSDPQTLPRLTIQGEATEIPPDSEAYALARETYVKRHPNAEPLFDLGDFALYGIRPGTIRFVAGFARAFSLLPDSFARALGDGGTQRGS